MKRIVYFPLMCLAWMGTANAQSLLRVEEAIARALQQNFDIRLAKNDSITAAIDNSYRNAGFYPRVNATAGKQWNNNEIAQTLADGSKRAASGIASNNLTAQLALNWTLYDGMRMFMTRDRLAQLLQLGELTIKTQVVNTVADVINTYYNIVRQKQQVKNTEEQIALTEERIKVASYKKAAGAGAKPDILQSQVDLNAQRSARLLQQTTIAQLKEQLNLLMGSKPGNNYEVADSIPTDMNLTLGNLLNGLEQVNPLLLRFQKNIDLARLALRERRAERYPVVAFNANYNYNRTVNKKVINNFSTLFNRNNGYNFGLFATIPIFNNYTVKRQVQQAQADIQFSQLVYDNQSAQLVLQLTNAYKNYELQKKILTLEQDNISLAKENAAIVLEAYRLGGSTLLQLKEAQKSLDDAYNRLIGARYAIKLAETELRRLKGELVW